jgi:hypothetical protein
MLGAGSAPTDDAGKSPGNTAVDGPAKDPRNALTDDPATDPAVALDPRNAARNDAVPELGNATADAVPDPRTAASDDTGTELENATADAVPDPGNAEADADAAGTTNAAAPALADPTKDSVSIAPTTPATRDHRPRRNHCSTPTERTIRAQPRSPTLFRAESGFSPEPDGRHNAALSVP